MKVICQGQKFKCPHFFSLKCSYECAKHRKPHELENPIESPCTDGLSVNSRCYCVPVPLSYYMKEVLKKDKK